MDGGWPDGPRRGDRQARLAASRRRWARKLGDPADPLLVSVRSGAKFSMPGMMDTVLNLGPQRRVGRRAWPSRPTTSASPTTPTAASSRCTAGSCSTSTGEEFDEPFETAKARAGVADRRRDPGRGRCAELAARTRQVVASAHRQALPAGPARPARGAPSRPCSAPGTAPGPSPTASGSASPTTSAPRSTCRPWCSATATTTRAPASGFTRDPATGENGPLRRLPRQRPGRGRGGRHPQHRAPRRT